MIRCIYCDAASLKPFPAEHVLPQMFGRFEGNLTISIVCGDCNNFFSRLELSFGRDSPEAIERLRQGLKPVAESHHVGRRRMRDLTVAERGLHEGARVRFSETGGQLSVKPVPQVGFRRGSERPVWFDEDELSPDAVAPFRDGYTRIIRGPTDEDVDRLSSRLKELNISVENPQPLPPSAEDGEEIDLLATYELDDDVQRVIAKIAFNYAAWVAGGDFVRQSVFDTIRQFVRHGQTPPWSPVMLVDRPILADETQYYRRERMHLLTTRWNTRTGSLLGQVGLFNAFNYWVALCAEFSGLWLPINSGHAFSLISRDVKRVIYIGT